MIYFYTEKNKAFDWIKLHNLAALLEKRTHTHSLSCLDQMHVTAGTVIAKYEILIINMNILVKMPTVHLTLFILFIMANVFVSSQREDEINTERYNKGKEKYEAIKRETMMPKYSQCWKSALQNLEVGCKTLNDDIQHRLALQFSNCFLLKTGRETYPCSQTQEIEECTQNMKPEAFNTYTEFFTHTQNICFFLQSQIWQEITENTISKLSDNSENVAKQLEDSGQLQSEIMKRQNESIKNQEILLQRGRELSQTIETSSVDIHHMLKEYKDATTEQRNMIFEVFDRLNSLQSVVMGEFTGFYSFIFYTLSVLVSYLLTSSQRTSGARFWLFAVMTINVVLERVVVAWGVNDSSAKEGLYTDESVSVKSGAARTLVMSHCPIITESPCTQSVVQLDEICSDFFGLNISIPLQ